MTSLRKAFSPAATRTTQKLHPAEKLLPLPRSISASSQVQPSGLAIALKAFCKKEAAWPEGAHYRTTPTARSQSPSCSSKTAYSQSRRCVYASATYFAPLLNGFDRFVETTTDISGVSTCPFERLILLGVILNAFIVTPSLIISS